MSIQGLLFMGFGLGWLFLFYQRYFFLFPSFEGFSINVSLQP